MPTRPPSDRFHLVYLITVFHGVAMLLPWNVIITATEYYDVEKLPGWNAMMIFGAGGEATSLVVTLLNICFTCRGNPMSRTPYSIGISLLTMLGVLVTTKIEMSKVAFFVVTLVLVMMNFVASGLYNSGMYYITSAFPMEYTNALVFGTNIGGVLVVLLKMVTPSVFLYFSIASSMLLIAFVLYIWSFKIEYFKRHIDNLSIEQKPSRAYGQIIRKCWSLYLCLWLGMFSTCVIFPLVQVKINRSHDFFISEKWFTDVTCFLTFNVFISVGNMVGNFVKTPSAKFIWIPTLIKTVGSLMFFSLCNYQPRQHLPVVFGDLSYWFGSALHAFAAGYLNSLTMMYIPHQVQPRDAGTASVMSTVVILAGVVSGMYFTRVLALVV